MKLKDTPGVVVKGAAFSESYEAKISEKNMHKLWDILQDPYKNPITAIVREYTSNAWDSHVEANVEDPVIVKIDKDSGGWYWSVEDFGVGMSEDRMKLVFIEYLETTKDWTNDQIGAFGIGSKSGLSYQDIVHYRTRYDGYEYTCMLRKGEVAPKFDIISKIPTEEKNGTLVKIYIKSSKRFSYSSIEPEIWKFKEACVSQLAYFHNVYFIGCDIDNDYKIYDGKTFKVSSITDVSNMHMCIGDVYYPIDWEQLKMEAIPISIGIKFNIGEVDLQFTREDVKYTHRTKNAIIDRIEDVKKELAELWSSSENLLKKDPIEFYDSMNIAKVLHLSDDLSIKLDDKHIHLEDIRFQLDGLELCKPPLWAMRHYIFYGYTVGKTLDAQGSAKGQEFTDDFDRALNLYSVMSRLRDKDTGEYNNASNWIGYLYDGNSAPKKNRKIRATHGKYGSIYLIRKRSKRRLKDYKRVLLLENYDKSLWRDMIIEFQKFQENYFAKACLDYGEIEIGEESDNTASSTGFDYREYRKSNALIFAKVVNGEAHYSSWERLKDDVHVFTKTDVKVSELFNNRGILIYGADEDSSDLKKAAHLCSAYEPFARIMEEINYKKRGNDGYQVPLYKQFNIIYLAKANWKYLPQHHNCMHVKEFLEERKMKAFGKICTANYIFGQAAKDKISNIYGSPERFKVFDASNAKIYQYVTELKKYVSDFRQQFSTNDDTIMGEAIKSCQQLGNMDYDILEKYNYIKDYVDRLDLVKINYLREAEWHEPSTEEKDAVRQYIRYHNKFQIAKGEVHLVKHLDPIP